MLSHVGKGNWQGKFVIGHALSYPEAKHGFKLEMSAWEIWGWKRRILAKDKME